MQVYEVTVTEFGTQEWRQEGLLHKLDGPAVTSPNGRQEWRQNGLLHRLDGPAVVGGQGSEFWYQHDKLHRVDGPAVILSGGTQEWYINDIRLSEEEFNKRTAPKPSCDGKTVIYDGVEYTLVSK